jgi:hypothetical protein
MSSAEVTARSAARAERTAERREQRRQKKAIKYPFWFGGSASSMAACVTHPLDLREQALLQTELNLFEQFANRDLLV